MAQSGRSAGVRLCSSSTKVYNQQELNPAVGYRRWNSGCPGGGSSSSGSADPHNAQPGSGKSRSVEPNRIAACDDFDDSDWLNAAIDVTKDRSWARPSGATAGTEVHEGSDWSTKL
jgi:hypothetical protein